MNGLKCDVMFCVVGAWKALATPDEQSNIWKWWLNID